MPDKHPRILWFCACLLYGAMHSAFASKVSTHFNLSEVAPGIYVHQGKTATPEQPGRDDIANIGFIIGEECIAVIDTGGSVVTGTMLRQALRSVSDRPVCYVINTHIHYDHLLGNAAFDVEGVKFVGHESLVPAVERNRDFFVRQYGEELGVQGKSAIVGPDITVQKSTTLDLGNRVLTLTAHQPAHTHNDLSVFDERTGTLWLSDLLFVDHVPVLDGSLKGWLDLLEKLSGIPAARAIPGHGPISVDWPAAVQPEQRYLTALRDDVRDMLARGLFMEDVLDKAGREEQGRWRLFDYYHRRNVSKAFTELEWE